MTSFLETLVNPSSGGTESRQGVTTDDLWGWQSMSLSEANISKSKNMSIREMLQTQLCAVSQKDQPQNPESKEDGVFSVVLAWIFS